MWTESRLDAKSKRLFCCAEVSGDPYAMAVVSAAPCVANRSVASRPILSFLIGLLG